MSTDTLLKKVLLVEDDPSSVFLVETVLKPYNIDLISARNGKQALMYLSLYYDLELVLLDILLPDMSGLEILHTIRARAEFLPVVAHSASASLVPGNFNLNSGFDDTLNKPYLIDDLIDMVAKFVRLKENKPARSMKFKN